MRKNDIIFSAICGLSVVWVCDDFLIKYGLREYSLVLLFLLPILSVFGLWLTDLIGRKKIFARQGGKFILAGSFANVVDIKIFQFIFLFLPNKSVVKLISFSIATVVKYFSDKHWTFEKHERKDMHKEMGKFFLVAVVGAAMNVVSFYFLTKIKTGISANLWIELSIILAAIISGLWNFLGYKYIVFKK